MAGRIILLEDFRQDDAGNQEVSAVFIYELTAGEKKTVGASGIQAKPTSAPILFALAPELFKYNLISTAEQNSLDAGDLSFEIVGIRRNAGEPLNAIRDKLRVMYTQKRAAFIVDYSRKYTAAGMEVTP
jgi:hypothetical protein